MVGSGAWVGLAAAVSPVQSLISSGGVWRRRGWDDPVPVEQPAGRPTNYGEYEPQEGVSAGVLSMSGLDPYTPPGDRRWRIGDENAVVEGYEVFGCVKPEAKNITYRNCYIHGLPQNLLINGAHQPLADCVSSLTTGGRTIFEDCTFDADGVWGGVEVVKGGNAIFRRCVFKGGIDGIQAYDRNMEVYGSVITGLVWIPDDPAQGAEGSHNDGIQFQGGAAAPYLTFVGNSINMGMTPAGSSCLGILVTADRGTAGGYTFNYNYVRTKQPNGTRVAHPMNIAVASPGGTNIQVRGNRFQLGKSGWHIIAPSTIKSKILTEPGNVDLDTGAAIIVQTGAG